MGEREENGGPSQAVHACFSRALSLHRSPTLETPTGAGGRGPDAPCRRPGLSVPSASAGACPRAQARHPRRRVPPRPFQAWPHRRRLPPRPPNPRRAASCPPWAPGGGHRPRSRRRRRASCRLWGPGRRLGEWGESGWKRRMDEEWVRRLQGRSARKSAKSSRSGHLRSHGRAPPRSHSHATPYSTRRCVEDGRARSPPPLTPPHL